MTHLHIPVPAITRGTLARTHELKSDIKLDKCYWIFRELQKDLCEGHGSEMVIIITVK